MCEGKFKHGSLFSGIGGFDLAAEWMGWENVFHCEWNDFGQKILQKHFPNSITYGDITTTDFTIHRGTIDIITGGFPCQPYSNAGRRLGKEDDRHLWPEMLRAIREISPSWVVGENVSGLISWNGGMVFDEVQADLEAEGYEILPFLLPACSVNAPHKRERVWFIAHAKCSRLQTSQQEFRKNVQLFKKRPPNDFDRTDDIARKVTERNCSELREGDGIPNWMDRIKALGNAIVPQVAFEIFKTIQIADRQNREEDFKKL